MMKILDRDGNEIKPGTLVRRVLYNGSDGGVNGVVTWVDKRTTDVTFVQGSTSTFVNKGPLFSRTRICSDLRRHDIK